MPGLNISRFDAESRSKHLNVHSYDVTIKIVPGSETFHSKSIVKFSCNSPGMNTFIDAPARDIISASLNGSAIDASNYDGESIFFGGLMAENELVIEMNAIFSKNGEGLQYSVDPVDREAYLYSQGGPALIRHMYACFDQPDLKATFALTAVVPSAWEVISNNLPTSKVKNGDASTTWKFPPTPPLATYITAFIAGPYYHVHDEYIGQKVVPLGIYCRKSLAQHLDPDEIFKVTKQGFAYFEKVFGLAYPFEKYDQIAVVDFNWGAMENVGAVTFKEELFVYRSKVTARLYKYRANTILHEMSHMWFGNMVTMKWWDDLWLNESFAEWAAYMAMDEATDYQNGWTEFNSRRKNWAYRQDQLSSTHPIVVRMEDIEAVNANFDGITYAKGASVLQQFVAHVGRDNFIAGLRNYFTKHAYGNTSLADLIFELEATSGRNLASWSATWLQTAGVNTLRPATNIENGIYKSIEVVQEPPLMPVGSTELRPHRLAVGLYDLKDGKIQLRKSSELDVAGKSTTVEALAGEKVADLLLINDRDMTYAKIRFDDRSIATLKLHLGTIEDSLARALCWSATWDMLRDGEILSLDFVTIAQSGLPGEDDITVVTALSDQLATTVDLYTKPDDQINLRTSLAASFELLMNTSVPSSDHQLQYARAFATLATSQSQNQQILWLLNGGLAGLLVDADLRWHLIGAACERGLLTKDYLDQELAKDNTTLGSLGHSYATAAIPSLQAKADTWAKIMDEEIPNATRVALMRGFHRPLQNALIDPYIDNYFSALLKWWDCGSFETATEFVNLAFPTFIATQTTLTKTDEWLSITGSNAPAGLKRLVGEARDSLVRALKVQSFKI